ncbi:MAG: hypothetical protein WDZ83_02280 [Rhizobiaceae bacterium]
MQVSLEELTTYLEQFPECHEAVRRLADLVDAKQKQRIDRRRDRNRRAQANHRAKASGVSVSDDYAYKKRRSPIPPRKKYFFLGANKRGRRISIW